MSDNRIKELIQRAGPVRLGLVIVCGIMLLLLSFGSFSKENKEIKESENLSETTNNANVSESLQMYRERMEEELVQLLEQVQGVGRANVMITVQASNEKVTLKDNTSQENKTQEETVLIEDSERNSSPYVIQEREPELEGVVVVCEGGGNAEVKREIIEAVGALFHIESHKIKVMKSKEASE